MAKAAVKGKSNTLCQLCEKMVPMEDWNIKGQGPHQHGFDGFGRTYQF